MLQFKIDLYIYHLTYSNMLIKSKLYNEVKEQDEDVKIHDYIKRINNNKLNDFTLDIVINIITNNIIKNSKIL